MCEIDLDYTYQDTWDRRFKNLKGMSYQDYLKSDHWKGVKEKASKRENYKRCECCGDYKVELHHRSYKSILTKDELRNIIALCREHHQEVHDLAKDEQISVRLATRKVIRKYREQRKSFKPKMIK